MAKVTVIHFTVKLDVSRIASLWKDMNNRQKRKFSNPQILLSRYNDRQISSRHLLGL